MRYEILRPMETNHPALPYERPVAELGTRAMLAVVALGATIVVQAWDIGARLWSLWLLRDFSDADAATRVAMQAQLESADQLVNFGVLANYLLVLVTAFLFLRWVHRLVKLTRQLGAETLRWRPSQAVWGFILPVLSLYRPYQVLRDVQQRLEPEEIEPPAPRVDRDAIADYRNVRIVTPPLAKSLPASFLGGWWAAFIGGKVIQRVATMAAKDETLAGITSAYWIQILASLVLVVAAVFAIRVVRSLTARLDERFRRIRYSTPEALSAQQIVLG